MGKTVLETLKGFNNHNPTWNVGNDKTLMKRKEISYFLAGIALIIAINVFASSFIYRIDLTEDKRYTILDATKKTIENLEDEVVIKIYLEGDGLPAEFKRMRNSIAQTLDEFKVYAGANLKYRFIDPMKLEDAQKDSLFKELSQKGIKATNIKVTEDGKKVEKLIFPGAIMSYKGTEKAILLLKGDQKASVANPAQILNQSIENLEYEFGAAIKQMTSKQSKKIGFLFGHGELQLLQVADTDRSLRESCQTFNVDLTKSKDLYGLDAIIVAKPTESFSDDDKYKIDQFIMRGGKALFFIDALDVREDSIRNKDGAVAFPYEHKLTDMFFRYGVRFNDDFIEDLSCGQLALIVGNMGDKPQMEQMMWKHYPLITNFFPHPIVRNLDALYTRYVSTLDTVKAEGIRKIPLAMTSNDTKIMKPIIKITYNDAREQPKLEDYKAGAKTVAYLLEGKFTSLFRNRITPTDARSKDFVEKGVDTKILICSDGDMIRNEANYKKGAYMPLGFDKNTGVTFANKKFILNAVDYLLDDKGIILARNKEIKMRPLDKNKLQNERTKWQFINMVVPVLVVVIFGLLFGYWRKRKYGK